MCFAPQRCGIFLYPNFQKGSGAVSFVEFVLKVCFVTEKVDTIFSESNTDNS